MNFNGIYVGPEGVYTVEYSFECVNSALRTKLFVIGHRKTQTPMSCGGMRY